MLKACADLDLPLLARISAGNVLGWLGDPRIDAFAPALCRVPRGAFWMGIDAAECAGVAARYGIPVAWMQKSTPRRRVELDAFEIARFPVTQGEWALFLDATELDARPDHWRGPRPPRHAASHPVWGVSFAQALLYAEWLSERAGVQYRIPSEAEWEKAARGVDGRIFPWGERFEARRCNTREGGIGAATPVGVYPDGASPCGALDMAGNVEEYTADLYGPYPGSAHVDGDFGSYRVTRGGCFLLDADLARCDRRHAARWSGAAGLRLCRSAADEWLGRE
jgi:formylglycine-generating enzyme required for sulfatase activity